MQLFPPCKFAINWKPHPCSLWLPLGLTNLAVIMITIPHFYTMDIKHWCYSNLVNNTHLHNTTWPTIFALTTCTIWLARNNLVFKTVSTSLASIGHIIISHAIDFTYISGQALVKAHLRAIRLISWTPLTNEFIKHNTW